MTEIVPAEGTPPAEGSILELARELESAGALSPIHLDLSERPDLPVETLESLAAFFGQVNHSSRWWIADLLHHVEMRHGELVAHIAGFTGLAEQTVENIMSVGNRVPQSRRRIGLSFSIHAEVAALTPNEQRRWLKVAEKEGLTKAQLRERIKPKELPPVEEREVVKCPVCGHAGSLSDFS